MLFGPGVDRYLCPEFRSIAIQPDIWFAKGHKGSEFREHVDLTERCVARCHNDESRVARIEGRDRYPDVAVLGYRGNAIGISSNLASRVCIDPDALWQGE